MKKGIYRLISLLLCLVVVFASMCICSVASEDDSTISTDNFNVSELVHNQSESKILVCFEHKKDGYLALGVIEESLNSYRALDFTDLLPQGSNYFEIIDYTVKGDMFVILVDLYNMFVTDEMPDGSAVGYDYKFNGSMIITTEDFAQYKTYPFTINQNDDSVFNEFDRYYELSAFGFVGDTFVYANTDYIITERNSYQTKGKGIYYTTTDFVNWNTCYTPEEVIYSVPYEDGLIIPGVYNYYSFRYTTLNNGLVVDIKKTKTEDILGYTSTSTVISKTIATTDFETYKSFFSETDDVKGHICRYMTLSSHPDSFFIIKQYYTGDGSYYDIVKADYKDGTTQTLYHGDGDKQYRAYQTDDCIYFTVYDNNLITSVCSFDGDLKYKVIFSEESMVEIFYGKVINNKFYAGIGNRLYAFDNGQCSGYRFSKKYDTAMWNVFNGKIFAMYEDPSGAVITPLIKTGDVDGDNRVVSSDALGILQSATGIKTLDENQSEVADVDSNGLINSSDALSVLQYATGLIMTLG